MTDLGLSIRNEKRLMRQKDMTAAKPLDDSIPPGFGVKKYLDSFIPRGFELKKCLDSSNPGRMILEKQFLKRIHTDFY